LASRLPSSPAAPRLRALAARRSAPAPAVSEPVERCELCGTPLNGPHRHLADIESQQLLCACRPCSLLFDRPGAGAGHLRLVPERRVRLDRFELSPAAWAALRIPVEMAFFFRSSRAGRVLAFYPSPMGPTESRLELASWTELERTNPILQTMEDDVEALLANRARGADREWLVPIDDCYRLVALIRTRWRGFTGGKEVWAAIDSFFDELDRRARPQESDPPKARRSHGQDQARRAAGHA
jgi:Family of unknown function (DUF5947)